MHSDKRSLVRSFLLTAKHLIRSGSDRDARLVLATVRQKNMDTISELELTMEDVTNEIVGLSVDDFCKGPLVDKQVPGDLWVFGKTIRGREVYIKLKLSGGQGCVTILSFHFPDRPLKYPFRQRTISG